MHTRMKSHLTKFNSKKKDNRESSACFKHLENAHGGLKKNKHFKDYLDVNIVKTDKKPMTKCIKE